MTVSGSLAALLMTAYVLAGGLDIGVGISILIMGRGSERDAALALVGNPWSCALLWSVLTVSLLISGVPLSFELLPALWLPLLVMLAALVVRAAAHEFRRFVFRRDLCDLGFGLSSLLAVACQGLVLGYFVHRAGAEDLARSEGLLAVVSVWGVLCAAGLVGIYVLLAAGWFIWAGRGAVRVFGREVGHAAVLLTVGAAGTSLLWAMFTGLASWANAFEWPRGPLVTVSLTVAALAAGLVWLGLWGRRVAVPLGCGVIVHAALLTCVCVSIERGTTFEPSLGAGENLFVAYLAFNLLLGSPLLLTPILGALRLLRRRDARNSAIDANLSHTGRRAEALANALHIS